MAQADAPLTSEVLARSMDTNPVVIRRILAGLRERGYVASGKGRGGGWTLARDLSEITLRDVYLALGSPELLAIGNRTDRPGCLVEQAVNARLSKAFDEAEERLLSAFGEVTLATLNDEVGERMAAWRRERASETTKKKRAAKRR